MSLYNMIHGVNPSVFFVLPMLGKHPDEYPRFRDCFLSDEAHPEYDGKILVYTRVGGANRGQGCGEEELCLHPNFVATYDDSFDNTYGVYVFNVPERWKADYALIIQGKIKKVSEEYQAEMARVYPKLADEFEALFGE